LSPETLEHVSNNSFDEKEKNVGRKKIKN